MKNNKIIEENNMIKKGITENNIVEKMKLLNFTCIFNAKKNNSYSNSNSNYYLFLNSDVGLCVIDSYQGKIDSLELCLNYQNKNPKNFFDGFHESSWSSSTGISSGYGYTIRVGNLNMNGDLKDTIDDLKLKGRFITPFIESNFLVPEDIFTKEEKKINPEISQILERTNWFIENKIAEPYRNFFGEKKTQEYENKRDVIDSWDDYINWNLKSDNKINIERKDKQFYTTCKDIILKDIEDIKPLINKNFTYQTTDLGQNFCHLMSIIQDPEKKELLWNTFKTLSPEHQTNFITQNDLNGYNPLLILVQHHNIKPVKNKQMNLDYFSKYLSLSGIETAFLNDKNSLLDCLFYRKSISTNNSVDFLIKIAEREIEIPKVFLLKQNQFSSEQKVITKLEGNDVEQHIDSLCIHFMNVISLNKKITKDLPEKNIDNKKLKKI